MFRSIICIFAMAVISGLSVRAEPFNEYIGQAVEKIYSDRSGGGYDRQRAFSSDLEYGSDSTPIIKASRPAPPAAFDPDGVNPTMCVAAVAEVIIEAINLYTRAHPEQSDTIYSQLPPAMWNSGKQSALRSHLFMYEGSGSKGTADALETFGLGRTKTFDTLVAYDFINLNRTNKSGHAVVFIAFLTPEGPSESFSTNIVGFRYFSAQGEGRPDAGFGYRNAYFDGQCPSPRKSEDDCGVIKGYSIDARGSVKQHQTYFNTGGMISPDVWTVEGAANLRMARIATRGHIRRQAATRGISRQAMANIELERELTPNYDLYRDGSQ